MKGKKINDQSKKTRECVKGIGIKKINDQAKKTKDCKYKYLHVPKIVMQLRKDNRKMYDKAYSGRGKGELHHIIGILFRKVFLIEKKF
jgi:hypothetical protein